MTKGEIKMTDKKTYLVSDLANELSVPRTTVNDWLKRYDRYLPSVMSGRRRTYTEEALEVLRSVNKMRNDGLSAGKIEAELVKTFAIRPEEVIENKDKTPESQENCKCDGNSEETVADQAALPVLRREEFDRFLGTVEEFTRMEKSRKRGALYIWIVILLICLFVILIAWFMACLVKFQAVNNSKLAHIQQENYEIQKAQKAADQAGKTAVEKQNKALSELRSSVISGSRKQEELREKELLKSQKAMAEMQKLIISVKNEQDSFRRKLEDRFEQEIKARELTIKLQENQKKAADIKLKAKEKELDRLKKETEKLRRELEDMKKVLGKAEQENKKTVSNRETNTVETAPQIPEKAEK